MNFEGHYARGGGGGGGDVTAGAGISVEGSTVSLDSASLQSLSNVKHITADTIPSIVGRHTGVDSSLAVGLDTYLFRDLHQQQGIDMILRELPATRNNSLTCGSGATITTGERNILYGLEALSTLSTGSDNIAIGYNVAAGVNGNRNVLVGSTIVSTEPYCTNSTAVGEDCHTKTNAVCIGQNAHTEESSVVIGQGATSAGARSVVVGRLAASLGEDTVCIGMNAHCVGSGCIAIGHGVQNDDLGIESCVIGSDLDCIRSGTDVTTDLGSLEHRFRALHTDSIQTTKINNLRPTGGVLAAVTTTDLSGIQFDTSMVGPIEGVDYIGSPILPVFQIGDSYRLTMAGNHTSQKGDAVAIRCYLGFGTPTVRMLFEIRQGLDRKTDDGLWDIDCTITVRRSTIISTGLFRQTQIQDAFEGVGFSSSVSTPIDSLFSIRYTGNIETVTCTQAVLTKIS